MAKDTYSTMPKLGGSFDVLRERDGKHTVVATLPTRAEADAKAKELAKRT